MPDVLFILLLALIIFGPKKLPEIARQIGKWTLQFRNLSSDLRSQLEREMLNIELEERQKKATLPPPSPPPSTVAAIEAEAVPEALPPGPEPVAARDLSSS